MLETPPTIRRLRPEEFPNNVEVIQKIKEGEISNTEEGYVLNYNETHNIPFKFYVEINIDNSRLWDLFIALTNSLPEMLSFICSAEEDDVTHSDYLEKGFILKHLHNYKTELTQDCRLEFGLIYQTDDKLEEVFVAYSKFIKIWSNNEIAFRQLMNNFNLKEIPDLNFIDEFPNVIEPLTLYNSSAKKTRVVVSELNAIFSPKKRSWKFW